MDTSRGFVRGILGVCVALILAISCVRILQGQPEYSYVTLGGFFTTLEKAPLIPTSWISSLQTTFTASFPSAFKWLGSIIDGITSIIQIPLYTSTMLLNIIPFLFYFVRYAFG